jgi:hypothetical protein
MTLKPGLAKHLKELEQKVFEMGSRSYVPGTTASSHSTTTTTTTTSSGGGGGGGGGQSDAELPQAVQRSLKDMKFEAVRLKKAGDREGAKEKLRLVRAIETISTLGATCAATLTYYIPTLLWSWLHCGVLRLL